MSGSRIRLDDLPAHHQAEAQRQLLAAPRPRTVKLQIAEPVDVDIPDIVQTGFSRYIVRLEPMGKPRMTQRDKWAKRPNVVRYRAYADELRAACEMINPNPVRVSWTAFFALPASWPKKKKAAHAGKPHRAKPDRDNVDKGILDALWKDDSGIAAGTLEKFWDDGRGARLEIVVQ